MSKTQDLGIVFSKINAEFDKLNNKSKLKMIRMLMGAYNICGEVYPRYLVRTNPSFVTGLETSIPGPKATKQLKAISLRKLKKKKKHKNKKYTVGIKKVSSIKKLLDEQNAELKQTKIASRTIPSSTDIININPERQKLPKGHNLFIKQRALTIEIAQEKGIIPIRHDNQVPEKRKRKIRTKSEASRSSSTQKEFKGFKRSRSV